MTEFTLVYTGSVGRALDFECEGLGFVAFALQVLSLGLGKIIHLHFLLYPGVNWVPVLLGKFSSKGWCLPNVLEIRDWLQSYGPYGWKKTNLYTLYSVIWG